MPTDPKDKPTAARSEKDTAARPATPRPARRERTRTDKPTPAEVAAEASSIYPDTFETPPSPDEIAAEAYAIYRERGGEHGRHQDDWYEAERRLRERRQKR